MIQLPKPSGPHLVGMRTIPLVDNDRSEQYATDPNAKREVLLNVWYPAQKVQAQVINYTPDFKYLVALNEGIDPKTLAHVEQVKTHSYSYDDAPLSDAQQKYPGIIFSPGSSSSAATYVTLCEELASHGYMVFGMNHPYMCAHLTFPDGRAIKADPLFTDATRPLADWVPLLDKEIETWIADIQFVMHWLKTNSHTRLDLERMGIFGHSFGGAAAMHCAQRSNDFKGVVNIDGPLFGALQSEVFTTPSLFLGLEYEKNQWFLEQLEAVDNLMEGAQADAYYVQMKNADHNSFREYNLLKEIKPEKNILDPRRSIAITRALLCDFFGKYLKNESSKYFNGDLSTLPELILDKI